MGFLYRDAIKNSNPLGSKEEAGASPLKSITISALLKKGMLKII